MNNKPIDTETAVALLEACREIEALYPDIVKTLGEDNEKLKEVMNVTVELKKELVGMGFSLPQLH